MSSERAPMRFDQVSHAAIQHTKLHFLQRFGTYGKSSYQIKEYDKKKPFECNIIQKPSAIPKKWWLIQWWWWWWYTIRFVDESFFASFSGHRWKFGPRFGCYLIHCGKCTSRLLHGQFSLYAIYWFVLFFKIHSFLTVNETLTSSSDAWDRFVVVVVDVAVVDVVKPCGGADAGIFGFGLWRQCLSYRIPNKTMKYSINARNTNSVQDINHTWLWSKAVAHLMNGLNRFNLIITQKIIWYLDAFQFQRIRWIVSDCVEHCD